MKLNWCGIYIPNKTSGLFQKLFLCDVVDVGIIGAEFFFSGLFYFFDWIWGRDVADVYWITLKKIHTWKQSSISMKLMCF